MAGNVDIQVAIGADARPLEREVAKARGSIHGLARQVEQDAAKMVIAPSRMMLPPVTQFDPRRKDMRAAVPGLPEIREPTGFGPLRSAIPPTIPAEVLTGAKAKIDAMGAASTRLGAAAGKAADSMDRAARSTRGHSVVPSGRESVGGGIGRRLIRMPEFNVMGRMEGLLGGFTLGGMLMWIRGAQQAATESRNLAAAAKLPLEEFLRLQKAAKDSGIPVEQLNAAIKDYGEGKITLEQVGEAVGLIGFKAGGATEEIKKLADSTRDLAEMDKQFKVLQEGASNFGKSLVVGVGRWFEQVSRMGIESVYQRRAVSWWEAGSMMQSEREQTAKQEAAKADKAIRETRARIRVEADLTDFFGDVEREAAKREKIRIRVAAEDEALKERIERITVQGPRAGDSLARIGGYMGGRMDNRGLMIAERTLKINEEHAQYTKNLVKIMEGDQ